jgi:hypothetical protein
VGDQERIEQDEGEKGVCQDGFGADSADGQEQSGGSAGEEGDGNEAAGDAGP